MLAAGRHFSELFARSSTAGATIQTQQAESLEEIARSIATLHERILRALVPSSPATKENVLRTARLLAASLSADGSWADIDYGDRARSEWKTARHLLNVLQMAVAYRTGAESRPPDLRQKANAALSWWLTHDPHNPNWWHNEIGVPKLLGTIALFMGNGLEREQLPPLVEMMKRSDWTKWTGQNLIWGTQIEVIRGILARDADTVASGYARMYEEVKIGPPTGEGIMPDFSFHQHGAQLYSGGYGLNFADDVGAFLSFAWGTPWQIPAQAMEIYTRYILDGVAWMTRGNVFDYSATGREITRKGKLAAPPAEQAVNLTTIAAAYRLPNVMEALAALDLPRKGQLAQFAARLKNDPNAQSLSGNRHYWCSDYMVHQRPKFFASVRMFSSRLINTELVNDEGKQSHHLADGCTFIYRQGDEYHDIFPVWDWSKVPGTTAERMDLLKQPGGPRYKTDVSFVGGVSDGSCGLAAQEIHRDTLRARKAWVMFNDGFVALGAGITSDSDRPVVTSVNQCLLREKVTSQSSDGLVWHDEVAYLFPSKQKFQLTQGPQTGRWSDIGVGSDQPVTEQVFNLWIDHGVRPVNADYEYRVYPGVSLADAHHIRRSPAVEVLSNTQSMQAVRVNDGRILCVVFWEPAQLADKRRLALGVNQPCLVMLEDRGESLRLSVANPKNEALRVNVTVGRRLQGEGASFDGKRTTLTMELPGEALAGSTVQREFRVS